MGRKVAGVDGLYSHVALTMEQEIADSLQTRWLRRSWSAREGTGKTERWAAGRGGRRSGGPFAQVWRPLSGMRRVNRHPARYGRVCDRYMQALSSHGV